MGSVYNRTELSNGLTIIGESNPANVSSAIGFFVKTGSRDESAQESGVSHFLEHMMFKGTPTRSAIDINLALGNLGAQANAFTSEENTVYYAAVIPERFQEMQELLSDMLRPALDPDEFNTEKQVILEEIALYQDRPHFYLFENAFKDYFGEHPAGNSVLGSHSSISEMTHQQMREYFDRRYSPENIVLVGTGNFSWDRFVSDAERLCGSWKRGSAGRVCQRHRGSGKGRVFTKPKLNQAHAVLITDGVSAQDESRYALALLANIMGDSTGSRIYWDLINTGLAESAGIDSDERDGTGCFSAYVSTTPELLDEVLGKVRGILATPREFTEEDLERAKAKISARVVLDGELPMGRLMALGLEWAYRRESTPLREIIERIRGVSRSALEQGLERVGWDRWGEYVLVGE